MMNSVPLGARLVLSIATLAYGAGPFVTDMNKTHLLHPAWPGHARFHLMWSSLSQLAVSAIALWLVWGDGSGSPERCKLAAGIGLCMTSGFWGAFGLKKTFHVTLHDPQGIPPLWGRLDGNLIAVFVIDGLLLWGWWLLPAEGLASR